ncbi:DUF5710 domain-containing protein [Massilia sp. LXY-6]|uniref:DUF5710 domain-containing protein n=1 Tax=Massilia sp. LXY-6 TaxID=3379823 RepID=UPI003EDEE64F
MMFLNVPYAEKDQARELGARWNPARKRWYVPDGVAPEPFARWMPKDGEPASAGSGRQDARAAKLMTGTRYLDVDHDCNPFEACGRCAPVLAESGWSAAREDVLKALR